METMRKEWGSPISKIQMFTPQEFVAACGEVIEAKKIGEDFWVDLVRAVGYNYTQGPDGIANEANVEHCLGGAIGPTNVYIHNVWYENMTLYKHIGSGDADGHSYSDLAHFRPLTGYDDVAIYVASGRVTYIIKGTDGLKPEGWSAVSGGTKLHS